MAIDEGLAEQLRDDLAGETLAEMKMFGGLCFLLNGNMVAGVMKGGALLFRVGKDGDAAALALPGTSPMNHGGRSMAGFVELASESCGDDATRRGLARMALDYARSLPPK
jgi:TfoX/Sxy family transcriptional regulator of competence genes